MLSIPHMIVIFVVVLVVFGPQKLPELARGLGKLMAEFRKASMDFRSAFEQEMHDIDRQAREAEWRKSQAATPAAPAVPSSPEPGDPSGQDVAGQPSQAEEPGSRAGAQVAEPSAGTPATDENSATNGVQVS